MNYTDFFNTFIKNNPLYQTNRSFMILMDKFHDEFLKETYEVIPKIFKDIYENGEIPKEVYDQVLVDCGVSRILIDELTEGEKKVFINSLSDFQRYKATVSLTETVIRAFGNNFEAYELFVDYNHSLNRWECKPYPIYKPEFNDGFTRVIPYKIVYEKVPNLLIHESQLDLMRENNLAAFPLKTNIVFISSNYNQSISSSIQNLIMSVFHETYKDELIKISFQNKQFEVTLHTFLLTWMYLTFNKTDSKILSFSGNFINYNNVSDNISINDLDRILEEYEQLGNLTLSNVFSDSPQTTFDAFYEKYFLPLKTEVNSNQTVLDKEVLNSLIRIENISLIDYIDNILSVENNTSSELTILIGDMIKSVEVYNKTTTDINFKKYFSFFKSFLPTIDFIPSNNTVYKILYYLKPFHTDFLDLDDLSMIFSNDKFNNIYFEIFQRQGLIVTHTDLIELESLYKFGLSDIATSDIAIISARMGSFLKNLFKSNIMYDKTFLQYYIHPILEGISLDDNTFKSLFSTGKATSDIAIISGRMGSFLKDFSRDDVIYLSDSFSFICYQESLENISLDDDFILLFPPS
jgi:hypothetical protein